MSNKIRKNLSEREFTDEDDYIEPSIKPIIGDSPIEPTKPQRQTYGITYRIDYIEPEEYETELDFYPTPSTEEVINKLVKKQPYLGKIRHQIKILRTNPIRKKDYGTR